jgi:TRAP-type mannitol/chloroaromatic compound transport system permease large subunit
MTEILAPAMFLCLVVALFAGFPVAFSLAAVAGAFGAIGVATGYFNVTFLNNMLFRIQGTFNNDNLLALPLLIFMGMLLERTGIAEEMFTALNRLFRASLRWVGLHNRYCWCNPFLRSQDSSQRRWLPLGS